MRKRKWQFFKRDDPNTVSPEWCCGEVLSANRYVELPQMTEYSRAVQRRIMKPSKPAQTIVDLLEWRRSA